MDAEKTLVQQFIEGGWVIPLIGAAGMLARLLANPNKITFIEQIKKIVSAALLSGIAWFILEQTDISSLYKAITYGIVGVISPEVINGIVKLGKKFQSSPEKFIKQ
jgi:hypothetical protein